MMNAKKFIYKAAQSLDLPADILAGVPRMELVGVEEFSIEPHDGLLEYEQNHISIGTNLGKMELIGHRMTIKLMNARRITIRCRLYGLSLPEVYDV